MSRIAPIQIGPVRIETPVILAPMTGVTDKPFRRIVKRYGAGLTVTEMIASQAAIRETRQSLQKMEWDPSEEPVSMQLAGCSPKEMAEAAKLNVTRHIAAFASKSDRRVLLEIIVALGRWKWEGTADWMHENVKEYDPPLAHAAMMALRRSANWPAVLKLLDAPSTDPLRPIALRAAAEQFDPALV